MKRRLLNLLILVVVLSMILSACSTTNENEPAVNENGDNNEVNQTYFNERYKTTRDTLTIATGRDYQTLMPYDWIGGPPARQYFSVVECLYEYNENLEPQPLLAENIDYDQDNLTVTVKLREGVKFHNGEEMKASDAVYSMKYLGKSSYGVNYPAFDYDNIKAIDDYSFVIPLKEIVGPIIDQLCTIFIFPESNTEQYGDKVGRNMVGTGPFKQGDWVDGDYLTLDRFDDYWGGPSSIKQILMRFIPEASVAQIELETGGVDLNLNVAGTDFLRVKNEEIKGFDAYMGSGITVNFVQFNCSKPPFDNKLVRQAVAYAVDSQAIVNAAFEGIGDVSWSNFATGSIGYDSKWMDLKAYENNIEKAKELLEEAGYGDGVDILAVVDPTPERVKTLEIMIPMLEKIGIRMQLQQYDSAAAMDIHTNSNDWNITARRMNLAADPSNDLITLTHPKNTSLGGTSLIRNDQDPLAWEYAALLDEAATTYDVEERIEIYKQVQEMMMENLWIYPTHVGGEKAVYPSNMKGFWYAGVFPHYDDIYFE